MTSVLSADENMINAYKEGKDLYAIIAQSAFNNDYKDNLEFYPAGTELELDGKKSVSGTGKEFKVETDENDSITVNWYELLETVTGDMSAYDINIGEKIISDLGNLTVIDRVVNNDKITFKFSL